MRVLDTYSRIADPTHTGSPVVDRYGASRLPGTTNAGPRDGVKVTVSAKARHLSVQSEVGVDEAKVARLRSAVESGSMHVDSARIASRIVEGY
jgi:flagellar biosynthesis anti-sigma factor FlgM